MIAHSTPQTLNLAAPGESLSAHQIPRWTMICAQGARILRTDWSRCLLLIIIAVVVRCPALQGERIWDDQYLSRDNPFIKSPLLLAETFRHYLFPDSFSAHYRPIQNISYFVDYFFWNTNEFGFHLTNVLLHATSGILLYFLARQLLVSLVLPRTSVADRLRITHRLPWISLAAFFVALLWVAHPVHSAAIDYISGRADSLAFAFAAGGWLLFFKARRAESVTARATIYLLAGLCGLAALLSREIALVWITLFLVHVLIVEKNLSKRSRILIATVCTALLLAYAGFRSLPQHRPTTGADDNWAAPVRITMMARALGDYARLLVWPSKLHLERTVFQPACYFDNPSWRNAIGAEYLSILGLAFLVVFVLASFRRGRGQSTRRFGAIWFLAGFLPVSNIVELNATVAEHWLYLPSVGFLVFLAGFGIELPPRYRKALVTAAIAALAGLSMRSYVRSTDWVTAETFYRRTLVSGGTSGRTALNLADIYGNRGQFAEAEKVLRKVLILTPDYPIAQNNLASALQHQGKMKEAEALFAAIEKNSITTRKEYPRTWIGALNLARVKYSAHDYANAIAVLEKARRDYTDVWELTSFESEVLRQTEGPDAALRLVEQFVHDNWWHHGAVLALGRLYAQKNDTDRAEGALTRASWLDIRDTESLRLLAEIRLRQNRLSEAAQTQRRAVARQPDEPRQYILLSDILEKMGRSAEARATLAKATQLRSLAQNPNQHSL